VLTGDGGDESFGGYLRYKAMKGSILLHPLFRLMGGKATGFIAGIVPHTETAEAKAPFRYISRLISGLSEPPALRNARWHSIFTDTDKARLYSDRMKGEVKKNGVAYLQKVFENANADNVMDRAYYTDINAYLPECVLVKMDVASMANSLEARSPFLDHKVMEFSASLPSSWKVHGLTTKYILKKAFKDFLPGPIVNRCKMGFGIPLGKWFRDEWKDIFRGIVLSEKALQRGYFNKATLENIYNDHVEGKKDYGYRMWVLLMLELWHNVYCDGEYTYE
jgi:asparagine synthase (glutamine-hydrolysing)